MKLMILLLLAGVCQTYTPITERSWVKFRKVPCPTYKSSPLHSELNIIHATDILIEERIDKISTMIRKSVSGLKYVTGRTLPGDYHINRIKRAKEVMPDGLVDTYEQL